MKRGGVCDFPLAGLLVKAGLLVFWDLKRREAHNVPTTHRSRMKLQSPCACIQFTFHGTCFCTTNAPQQARSIGRSPAKKVSTNRCCQDLSYTGPCAHKWPLSHDPVQIVFVCFFYMLRRKFGRERERHRASHESCGMTTNPRYPVPWPAKRGLAQVNSWSVQSTPAVIHNPER